MANIEDELELKRVSVSGRSLLVISLETVADKLQESYL